MINAIVTKYVSNARVKASAPSYSPILVPVSNFLDAAENHQAAATKLARNIGFRGVLVGAWKADKMVWVDKDTMFRVILI